MIIALGIENLNVGTSLEFDLFGPLVKVAKIINALALIVGIKGAEEDNV